MKGGQCELAPLLLWDPVAKAGSKGRNVLAGREGQDDLVAEVWRAAQPKRLIGSLNRDTGASPGGPQNELNNAAPKSPGLMLVRYFMACACPNDDVRYSAVQIL